MLMRFVDNNFTSNFYNTIGVDFKIKNVRIDNKNIKLQIVFLELQSGIPRARTDSGPSPVVITVERREL